MAWNNDQVSKAETEKILELARKCLASSGDFVELGCYKGDTSLLIAEVLDDYQRSTCGKPVNNPVDKYVDKYAKKLWIYDSFEGLPEKSASDESVMGVDFKGGELAVTKREVKERFLRAGLKVPIIKKGWFADLTEADLPEKIAFAFIDGDFYDSIRDALKAVDGKMAENAVMIVHDYKNPALPGVEKAVKEWLEAQKLKFWTFESMVIFEF